ncbi:MAG: SpoIIE family protein phosphatase [Leptospiraceae bacterium]|nr:SpoIIE family protein phosphatase [Leptospiraceae bacterium]MCP5493042.1 SpoIIE family protein phosphatase [Leptospiraceae bacterium]
MDYFNYFYINYFTLATSLNLLFLLLCSVFLLVLPNKSKATWYLGIALLMPTISAVGYVVSQGFYHPYAVYGRLIVLIFILFQQIALLQFIFHFPDLKTPRLSKDIFYIQTGIVVLFSFALIWEGFNSEAFYDFDGHYYEFDMPFLYKMNSYIALFCILITITFNLWKISISPKDKKLGLILILIGIMVAFLAPGIGNLLNKLGLVSRYAFIGTVCFSYLIGFFLIMTAYINNTKDKTTFMFKIVGISFLTFMLIYNALSYFIMNKFDEVYDNLLNEKLSMIVNTQKKTHDLRYVIEYIPETNEYQFLFNPNNYHLEQKNYKQELNNAFVLQNLSEVTETLGKKEWIKKISNISIQDNEYLKGYIGYLLIYLNSLPNDKKLSGEEISSYLLSKHTFFYHNYNKIKLIPDKNFRNELKKYLSETEPNFQVFRKTILNHLYSSKQEDKSLKEEVLLYLSNMRELHHRRYRRDISQKEDFVSFFYFIPEQGKIYDVGFSYLEYRQYAHDIGEVLMYIVLFAIVITIFGIPLFLYGALLQPLKVLVTGIRNVRKGDLDVVVPIKVEDEIGFLSKSFNEMVVSIKESKIKLQEYSNQLEDMVEERTKELRLSLQEVRNLKHQQDGDYFLTTLLLKPLTANKANSDKIKIDFFIKQKKEFQFNKRNAEIGGDICISHSIQLRGKNYIVFLNADAMGKSIQGAGGVLVLGAVFQSIIQRTSTYKSQSDVSPEKWIKMAFKEMHKIFESFDGSMLISLIFGLVEEETAFVYYINAEHPWLILYRDGVADFIEKDLQFWKLGTPSLEQDLFISTFQMMPGDLLVMGSDGKDDLVVEKEKNKNRVINEEQTLFLKRVEETKGSLNHIFEVITGKYEIMDDFSLLSIRYLEPIKSHSNGKMPEEGKVQASIKLAKTALKQNNIKEVTRILENTYIQFPNNQTIARSLIKSYIKQRNYQKATELGKTYLFKNENDTEMMLKTSICMKILHEFGDAIELAERIKLREPKNITNLLHLAEMHLQTKNYIRASKLIQKVLQINPYNDKAKELQKSLPRV